MKILLSFFTFKMSNYLLSEMSTKLFIALQMVRIVGLVSQGPKPFIHRSICMRIITTNTHTCAYHELGQSCILVNAVIPDARGGSAPLVAHHHG